MVAMYNMNLMLYTTDTFVTFSHHHCFRKSAKRYKHPRGLSIPRHSHFFSMALQKHQNHPEFAEQSPNTMPTDNQPNISIPAVFPHITVEETETLIVSPNLCHHPFPRKKKSTPPAHHRTRAKTPSDPPIIPLHPPPLPLLPSPQHRLRHPKHPAIKTTPRILPPPARAHSAANGAVPHWRRGGEDGGRGGSGPVAMGFGLEGGKVETGGSARGIMAFVG